MNLTLLLVLYCTATMAQTQMLTGTVVNTVDSVPIARAKITISGANVNQTLLTGADGSFIFAEVPAGSYRLSAERLGYFPLDSQGRNIGFAQANVEPDKKPDPVTLRLIACATLIGSVTDENDLPLPGATVHVIQRIAAEGRARLAEENQSVANDLGEFRLFGVRPGTYLLCASAMPSTYQKRHRLAYVPTCFPNVTEPTSAQWISLASGEQRKVRFRMEPVHGIRVSGSVANAESGFGVSLQRTDPPGFPRLMAFASDLDQKASTFNFPAVPPGDYLILGSFNGANGQNAHATRAIHAGLEDVRDIPLALRDGPYLTGDVRMGNAPGSPENMPVAVSVMGEDLIWISPNASGRFRQAVAMPGLYSLSVFPPPGWHVQSITQAGMDVRDRKIAIIADIDPEPIDIVLAQGGGTIEITFSGPVAEANAGVKVTLLRRSSIGNEWAAEGRPLVEGAVPNAKMSGVAPGEYLLFAWPLQREMEYLNPEVIEKYKSFGVAVSVRDGETARVTLKRVEVE